MCTSFGSVCSTIVPAHETASLSKPPFMICIHTVIVARIDPSTVKRDHYKKSVTSFYLHHFPKDWSRDRKRHYVRLGHGRLPLREVTHSPLARACILSHQSTQSIIFPKQLSLIVFLVISPLAIRSAGAQTKTLLDSPSRSFQSHFECDTEACWTPLKHHGICAARSLLADTWA